VKHLSVAPSLAYKGRESRVLRGFRRSVQRRPEPLQLHPASRDVPQVRDGRATSSLHPPHWSVAHSSMPPVVSRMHALCARPDLARCRQAGHTACLRTGRTGRMNQPVPVLQPRSRPRHEPFGRGRRVLGLAPRGRHQASASVEAPTDAQIVFLIASARRLVQRQRDLHAVLTTPEAGERMLRLNWAVRAGESVLTARAAEAARAVPHPSKRPIRLGW